MIRQQYNYNLLAVHWAMTSRLRYGKSALIGLALEANPKGVANVDAESLGLAIGRSTAAMQGELKSLVQWGYIRKLTRGYKLMIGVKNDRAER